MYTLTRTSEVYNQPLGIFARMKGTSADASNKVVKYQISHQYYLENFEEEQDDDKKKVEKEEKEINTNPAKCTLELTEYLINFNNQTSTSSSLKLVGRKNMLLSDVAQYRRVITFDNIFILPYFDKKGQVKGS